MSQILLKYFKSKIEDIFNLFNQNEIFDPLRLTRFVKRDLCSAPTSLQHRAISLERMKQLILIILECVILY